MRIVASTLVIKNFADIYGLGYALYVIILAKKKWFKATISYPQSLARMFVLLFTPDLIFQSVANQSNLTFYKRNRSIFER